MINILVVSKEAWGDTRWARKQWLPYYLSKRNDVGKVVYLDRHAAWWRGEAAHKRMESGKVEVLQKRLLLPFEKTPFIRLFNRKVIARSLVKHMSLDETWVSLIYHPFDFPMVKDLKSCSQVVFDWTEDWETFHEQSEMSALQRSCVEQADIVFTVTKTLYDRAVAWRGSSRKVFHIPNATAFDEGINVVESEALKSISSPRIGFVGHAGPWFDEELVAELADARRDWQWVMVGGATEQVKNTLQEKANVHWLGVYKPENIPTIMAHCDVLVAPYVKGIQGDATKLYDYLTVKKPIVSTVCETAESLKPWVMSCEGKQAWLENIQQSISAGDLIISDRELLANHWSTRAEQVMATLKGAMHV